MLTIEELRLHTELDAVTDEALLALVAALEQMVRSSTNNDFAQPFARIVGKSEGDCVQGRSVFLLPGERVQITRSPNAGLYWVVAQTEEATQLDRSLVDGYWNVVTRVVYPADVKQGVLNLLKWEVRYRERVGVKSEELSRWRVTYFDQDAGNTDMGYPISLVGFLKPYRRARF